MVCNASGGWSERRRSIGEEEEKCSALKTKTINGLSKDTQDRV
jgi:hypothetical protein